MLGWEVYTLSHRQGSFERDKCWPNLKIAYIYRALSRLHSAKHFTQITFESSQQPYGCYLHFTDEETDLRETVMCGYKSHSQLVMEPK